MSRCLDIVLLILDTQRADRLSCYGHHLETSPHFDTLAADATLFRRAVAPGQWTIPSHASMFTGMYPSHHHTHQSNSAVPATLPTLAERLRDGGYFTAGFCNNPLVGVVNNGLRRGFLSFLNYSGLLTSRPNQIGVSSRLLDRWRQVFKRFLSGILSHMQDAFARSDLLLSLSFTPLMVPMWQTALSFKGNTARSLHDAARLLVERKGVRRDQPIFCFINLMGVHMPYRPAPTFVERFAPHVLSDKNARHFLQRFNNDVYGWLTPLQSPIDHEHKAILDGMYNAEVANQDTHLGMFLDRLRTSGALDHTLLVVGSDHGDHLGEKQLMGHGCSVYNELVHVPLVIRDPTADFPRGTTVEQPVSTRRLFHTILTAAGLADETERIVGLAHSNANDPDKGVVFAEGAPPQNALRMLARRQPQILQTHACDQMRRAVFQADFKLIQTGEDRVELYNIADDPGETLNLGDMFPEQVTALQDHLDIFATQVGVQPTPSQALQHDHAETVRRLRDLGYLE